MTFLKITNCGIILNVSVNSTVITTLLIGLDVAWFVLNNISTEIDVIEYNNLFYSKKLKDNLLKYANLFNPTKYNRIILVITEFEDSLSPYNTNDSK